MDYVIKTCPERKQPEHEGRLDCETCGYGKRVFGIAGLIVGRLRTLGPPFVVASDDGDGNLVEAEDEDRAAVLEIICGAIAAEVEDAPPPEAKP